MIALAPGSNWGTSSDQITVVGAHWDTVRGSPGYQDNGYSIYNFFKNDFKIIFD